MSKSSPSILNRRTALAGAGAAGALAAAATVLPGGQSAPAPAKVAAAKPEQGGGYQLTEHVKQYYATARV